MTSDYYKTLFADVPFPGLVIHPETWQILAANRKMTEFSGYKLDDIIGKNIRNLLPDYKLAEVNPGKDSNSQTKKKQPSLIDRGAFSLVHSNLHRITVSVKSYSLPYDENPTLVIFEPDQVRKEMLDAMPSADFWQTMESISRAANGPVLSASIKRIINISQAITGAEKIVIYKMAEDQPVLRKWLSSDQTASFPNPLSAQELVSLSDTQLWKPGHRTLNTLHRYARQEKFSYLAAAPLGEKHALVGLVVLAGASSPVNNLINFTQYLSGVLSLVLERYNWRKNVEKDVEACQSRINSANIVEERISDGLILLGKTLEIKRLNSSAETILGYNHQEVKGQHVSKILIGTELLNQALRNAQDSNATFRLGDNTRLYRRNGESFQAVIRIFPIIRGKLVEEILVLIQDLSEQEFIKQQAQHLEQRAFLGEVTATFAHEIRNPVHNISTGLQLMAYNLPKDDPKQRDIDLMIQDCDRIAELIKSVLAFSKPVDYEMENVDIVQMLKHLYERLRSRIARNKVESDLQISPECPSVFGNMHALEQVINNLVSNALQAMEPDGGRLVIKAHPIQTPEGRQFVEISVADTGRGIPKENQERIFQPFFTTEKKGTGLGLAVSKRILTAHRGTIRLTSFPGGTVFHIQLPASKTQ
jgi:two-component system sensor histidine kinase AtoS